MKRICSMIALLSLALIGCGTEKWPIELNGVKIDKQEYVVDAAEGSWVTATFEVSTEWSVFTTQGDDWLIVTPMSGHAGVNTIWMTAAENSAKTTRLTTVWIECEGGLLPLFVVQAGQVASDDPSVPGYTDITEDFDPLFAKTLEIRGYVADADHITLEEVEKITELDVSGSEEQRGPLTSLEGIEYFRNLKILNCWANQLTTLDLSGCSSLMVLKCANNELTTLDLSDCSLLTILYCWENKLATLILDGCSSLEEVWCFRNQLTTLDLSGCSSLGVLQCFDNRLTTLDLSDCPLLGELQCFRNQLTTLNLSNCPILTYLHCEYNQLTSLDISANTRLAQLYCRFNAGDGSVFPITAWFDNENIPTGFARDEWTYKGHTITIDYRKAK